MGEIVFPKKDFCRNAVCSRNSNADWLSGDASDLQYYVPEETESGGKYDSECNSRIFGFGFFAYL